MLPYSSPSAASSKNEPSSYSWLFLIISLSLAGLFYFVAWQTAPIATNDTAGYQAVAQDLHNFRFDELRLRPPGYALLLLGTGSTTQLSRSLFAASLFLHLASVALLYRLLWKCGTTAWLARFFVVLALLPIYVHTAAMALTEVLTCFLITFAVVQAVEGAVSGSTWRFAASGAALAYAGFTHPLFLVAFLPVVFGLAALRWPWRWSRLGLRQIFRGGILLSVMALLGVLALVLFNSLAYGYKGVSAYGGINLSSRTALFVERLPESYGAARRVMIEFRDKALLAGKSHTAEEYLWEASQPLKQVTGLDDVQLDALLKKMNVELIEGSPLLYLNEVGSTIVNFWMPRTDSLLSPEWLRLVCATISGLMIVIWGLVVVLLTTSSLLMIRHCYRALKPMAHGLSGTGVFRRGASFQIIANLMIGYTCLMACAFGIGEVRYRAPVELLLLASAVHGVQLLATIFNFAGPKRAVRDARSNP